MYVYIKTETQLWTVGHYEPGSNKFIPESDYGTVYEAADRVHYLNGGIGKRSLYDTGPR